MRTDKAGNSNCVTLVRVSTKKQGGEDRFGMDAQRASNARIVADQGFTVRKTVEYADVSGDAVMLTPEMEHLQVYLRTPAMKGGHLVAKELSRLLRPNYDSYPLLQVFVDQKISIHLPQYVLQLWTPEGRMLAGVMCAVDFNEAEKIRDRCMGGREAARQLGHCASGSRTAPTGTLWNNQTRTWSYDPLYAPIMPEIYRMIAAGETNLTRIIRTFQFKVQGSKTLATPSNLRRLLQNRIFIGERVWDKKFDLSVPKEQLTYVKDGKVHRRNRPLIPREPHEVIKRQVITPGLVSVELFDRVQAILRGLTDRVHQSHAINATFPKFTYRGLLFCGDCGQPLYSAASHHHHRYYKCRDYFPNRGGKGLCKAPAMNQAKLEAELDRLFSREFSQAHFFFDLLKKHGDSQSRKSAAKRRDQLQARQKALADKRERIIDYGVDGAITKDDRDRRLKPVDDEIAANRQLLDELVETPLPTFADLEYLMQPFRKGFAGLPADEKRRLIQSRFQSIRVKDYRVVSLYLLTGDVVTTRPSKFPDGSGSEAAADWAKCYLCGFREKKLGEDYCIQCMCDRCGFRGKEPYGEYCAQCTFETEKAAERGESGPKVHPNVLTTESKRQNAVSDTSHGS